MSYNFFYKSKEKAEEGFSLIESMTSLAIMVLLFTLAIPSYRTYQQKTELQSQIDEIVGQISLAREKTISSDVSSSWGLRISISTSPQTVTIFNGNDYNGRNVSEDIIFRKGQSFNTCRLIVIGCKISCFGLLIIQKFKLQH